MQHTGEKQYSYQLPNISRRPISLSPTESEALIFTRVRVRVRVCEYIYIYIYTGGA
jgi:hypothetical protein